MVQKYWYVGYVISFLVTIALIVSISYNIAADKYFQKVQKMESDLVTAQLEQEKLLKNLVEARRQQNILADVLVSWVDYNKSRTELVKENAAYSRR